MSSITYAELAVGAAKSSDSSGDREKLDSLIAKLRAETSLSILTFDASASPGIGVVVVRPPGADKGTGIARLAELHGCAVEEVVAVGDWLNDVAMFRVAGRSFAVPGCPEVLAQVATDRLVNPGGQGAVAEAVAKVWS